LESTMSGWIMTSLAQLLNHRSYPAQPSTCVLSVGTVTFHEDVVTGKESTFTSGQGMPHPASGNALTLPSPGVFTLAVTCQLPGLFAWIVAVYAGLFAQSSWVIVGAL